MLSMKASTNLRQRAPRNKTLCLAPDEIRKYAKRLLSLPGRARLRKPGESCFNKDNLPVDRIENTTICGNTFEVLDLLPDAFAGILFADPPYNLDKKFRSGKFKSMKTVQYELWLDSWIGRLPRLLKPDASIYICADWRSSESVRKTAEKYFIIRNRITWEREKGRGALGNWKNCSEDIWFCTASEKYFFNAGAVKIKKRVIAPYRNENGKAKDWRQSNGGKYRLTHASNLWTDLTVPFWSMPENTEHPAQKPEKLLARIILASSKPGEMVFDPFLGSGTTSAAAKKLGRRYCGVEIDKYYCCLAEKRLEMADKNKRIQN